METDAYMKLIGLQIRAAREGKGISQQELAEHIGVSTIFISTIERGIKSPSLETFISLCNELEISADILMAGVLTSGYKIRSSLLMDKIEELTPKEQNKILAVVDTLLTFQ